MVYYENKDWKENSVKRNKNPAGGNLGVRDSIFLIVGECAESVNGSPHRKGRRNMERWVMLQRGGF